MALIGKLLFGKTAVNIASRGARKVETKVKRKVKRTKRTIALMTLSFCAGVGLTAFLAYQNRQKLAVLTLGKRNIRWRRLKKK